MLETKSAGIEKATARERREDQTPFKRGHDEEIKNHVMVPPTPNVSTALYIVTHARNTNFDYNFPKQSDKHTDRGRDARTRRHAQKEPSESQLLFDDRKLR